jgi:hypothetical protein
MAVRKNAACKESSREKSHVQDRGLMTGTSLQADRGKMALYNHLYNCIVNSPILFFRKVYGTQTMTFRISLRKIKGKR